MGLALRIMSGVALGRSWWATLVGTCRSAVLEVWAVRRLPADRGLTAAIGTGAVAEACELFLGGAEFGARVEEVEEAECLRGPRDRPLRS